jgi:hypothetical protein
VDDEVGLRIGAQPARDETAERFVRPPALALVAFGQLDGDFSD